MLDDLVALIALREHGTMTRAATSLRLSQSAVSKRIAALGGELGAELLRPVGRRVQLTPFAAELVERTAPLLAELRHVMQQGRSDLSGELPIAVSESVLASWGPRLLARVQADVPGVRFAMAAHRSPVAIDLARSGEVMLALVAGQAEGAADLSAMVIGAEPMVVVTSPGCELRNGERLELMTIEPHAATWQSVESVLRARRGLDVHVTSTLQSFSALAQMARAGFGNALVPLGIAQAMKGGKGSTLLAFPEPGLSRPISLVGRTRTFDGALVSAVSAALEHHAANIIPEAPRETL